MTEGLNFKDFTDWLGREIYLAARDSAVSTRFGVLVEVYEKVFGVKPDLDRLERELYGEHRLGQN